MSQFECPNCKIEMPFDHRDYYDYDIFRCPKCGHEIAVPEDAYYDDEILIFLYGEDYFDDVDWADGQE